MTLTLSKGERIGGVFFLLAQFLAVPVAVTLVCYWAGIASDAVINIANFAVNAALALLCFRRLLAESFRRFLSHPKQTLLTALKGFALYWVVNIAMTALTLMFEPDFGNVNDANILTLMAQQPVLMTLAVIFAAPLAEECLFRGWIFTGLARRSVALAYAVSCGFFSAAHVVGYIGLYEPRTLVLCFIQYLGPSFVLCRTCQKDDSLCAPLLMHMAINAMSCIFLG